MANEPKRQHCGYCGQDLGVYPGIYGLIESCGSAECEREIREIEREQEAAREERARSDHYERY